MLYDWNPVAEENRMDGPPFVVQRVDIHRIDSHEGGVPIHEKLRGILGQMGIVAQISLLTP